MEVPPSDNVSQTCKMSNTQRQHSRPMAPSPDAFDSIALKYPKPRTTVGAGAGAKRLFSDRQSKKVEEEGENAPAQIEDENEDEVTPTIKRYRSAEWPLSNSNTPRDAPKSRTPLRNRSAQSPLSSSHLSPSNRSSKSKFMEGSMNDRVSFKPPTPYLDDGELLSEYDAGIGGRDSAMSPRADSNRHSIFRFGRSIASSFNPNNWKIWSKEKHEEEEDEETAHAKSMRESKEKAERIYRELKESGRFRDAANVSQTAYQPTQSPQKRQYGNAAHDAYRPSQSLDHKASVKHDSGYEFNDKESNSRHSRDTSVEDKRKGRLFADNPMLQQSAREYSPTASQVSGSIGRSNSLSPFKKSFMKRGSLSNLSNHFKKPSLSNMKKSFMGESRESLAYSPVSDIQNQARRMPSRKDLQKQQKLVKRVSNLEGKLEAARRELSDALNQPVPAIPPNIMQRGNGRSRFVPGALASLPSERLLTDYIDPEDLEDEDEDGDGSSVNARLNENLAAMKATRHDSIARNTSVTRKASAEPSNVQRQIIIQSVEIVPEIEDSQEAHAVTTASTTVEVEELKDISTEREARQEPGDVSENEVTPKAPKVAQPVTSQPITPPKKRKSAFSGLADDGGIYKPSVDEDETDDTDESVVKKLTTKPKTPSGLARPSKHQKTATSTLEAKPHSPAQNTHVAAPRIRAKAPKSSIQAPTAARRGSVPNATSSTPPQPTRKLNKVQASAPSEVKQSANSPPSTPTFMGMKYEKSALAPGTSKPGPRVATPTNARVNPANMVYSADPNVEADVPPMPELPKGILRFGGESVGASSPVHKAQRGRNSPAKPRASSSVKARAESPAKLKTPSPKKQGGQAQEKNRKENEEPFEWPEDIF